MPILCDHICDAPTITYMNFVVVPHPDERRLRPRIPVDMAVEAFDNGPALRAHDIGIGGMLVSSTRPRWPGQHVTVRFKLPKGGRAIRATCRVLELVEAPQGVGLSLQFLALAPKAQLEILRFVGDGLQDMRTRMTSESATVVA